MVASVVGEITALAVSVCWAVSSSVFERSSKRVGSLSVNYIRLIIAFIMLAIYGGLLHGTFLPMGATTHQWFWLSLSGFFGFFIGDLFLFRSLSVIGARLSMLIMTFSPAMTAIIGWLALNEGLVWYQWVAILLITFGILMAFVGFNKGQFAFKMSVKGFLFALVGALGQALGLICSKKGMAGFDPFAATQIRIITGLLAFTVLLFVLRRWSNVSKALKVGSAMRDMTIGSFFGPFLGVAMAMYAISKTNTGVASALMSLTPLVLFIPSVVKGRHIARNEWIGALVSVLGVVLLFL